MTSSNLIYNCPGCGNSSRAPEGATVNRCEYCSLIVRIAKPGTILKYFYAPKLDSRSARSAADRFLKDNEQRLTGAVVNIRFYYLPFYRFRGLAVDYLRTEEVIEIPDGDGLVEKRRKFILKGKDFDITFPAFDEVDFGLVSLGIRPAAVPLYAEQPVLPEGGVIVGSALTGGQARELALKQHEANLSYYDKAEPLCQAMIGGQISVVYFPIWVINHEFAGVQKAVFVDALAGRGYQSLDYPFNYDGPPSTQKNSIFIKPERHQCPNCGADLAESQFSLFFGCKNCRRSFLLDQSGLKPITPQVADGAVAPYWRYHLEIKSGKAYKKVADYSELLVSELSFMAKDKRENPFYLYAPAFRSADVGRWAEAALRMFRSQPNCRLENKLPPDHAEVTIAEAEAREMAVFLWQVSTYRYPNLRDMTAVVRNSLPEAGELVWFPQSDIDLINKAAAFRAVNTIKK